MTDFYMDIDTGDDGDNGTTWALAKLTLEGLLAVMSAGDTGWIQGAAADTAAATRTFTSPGTAANPCVITGVIDGTTNEPPIPSDLASTLPLTSNSGAGNDIIANGIATYANVQFTTVDRLNVGGSVKLINGKLTIGGRLVGSGGNVIDFENTIIDLTTTNARLSPNGNSIFNMKGGAFVFTAVTNLVLGSATGKINIVGADISGLTTPIVTSTGGGAKVKIKNCKMPASFTLFTSTPTDLLSSVEVIASSDTTSQAADSSIQDYQYEDAHGSIDAEFTAVRTGGADDSASGAFAYAMTPSANGTLESSQAALKSPWMRVWVAAGSQTLTVYIANDSASTDYLEDEVWCEFYTPDSGDTAQHEQNFDPADERLFTSSTAVTDDTGSTWGTGANNHQKMEATVTPGFEGWAYARLHLAKRQATPDTLFLDPKIAVS